VEASVWRLYRKGFDIAKIISGMGTCPIAPPIKDELQAMDRVNTALLYGVTVRYVVDCEDSEIEAVVNEAPFSASRRYGERFIDIFEEGHRDFYVVDKDIHTVARYEFFNYNTGSIFSGGTLREDMIKESFYRKLENG
jgi:methenyltetrahydromethanopterin cyclohydrolase